MPAGRSSSTSQPTGSPSPGSPQYQSPPSPHSQPHSPNPHFPDAGPALREQLRLDPDAPVNLHSLPDPPQGQRPTHPLPLLTKLAIYGSPRNMLTLQEIYAAIEDRFEWYRLNSDDKAWKVRPPCPTDRYPSIDAECPSLSLRTLSDTTYL